MACKFYIDNIEVSEREFKKSILGDLEAIDLSQVFTNNKKQTNAVQKSSTEEVHGSPQATTPSEGSEYQGVGTSKQGEEITQESDTKKERVGKYEEKAKKLAEKIDTLELPDWLTISDKNVSKSGLGQEELKSALKTAVIEVGKLLDKGVDFKEAIKREAKNLADLLGQKSEEGVDRITKGLEDYYNKNVESPIDKIGVTNAFTERYRQEKGLEPILAGARATNQQVWDNVLEKYTDDQAKDIVAGIAAVDKPEITVEKQAIILRDRIRLTKEYNDNARALAEALDKGDTEAYQRLFQEKARLEAERDINDTANAKFGSEWGGIGNFRQELSSLDYSLENVMAKAKANEKDGKIPHEVKKKFEALVAQHEKLQKEYEDWKVKSKEELANQRKAHEEELIKAAKKNVRATRKVERKALADATIDDVAKAFKKFMKIGEMNLGDNAQIYKNGIPSEKIVDLMAQAVKKLAHGGIEIAEAIKQVREHISKSFDLKDIKDEDIISKYESDYKNAPPPESDEDTFGGLINALIEKASGEDGLDGKGVTRILQKLLRASVENGADNIDDVMNEIYPLVKDRLDVTREDLRDAITEYGKYKRISQEPLDVKIRGIKSLGKLIGALDDIMKKMQLPKRSGVERDKPNVEYRTKRREILQKIKELGLEPNLTADEVEAQYKSSVEAYHTTLNNEIEYIQSQIDKGERAAKAKGKEYNDEESVRLRTLLKQKRAELAEKLPKPELTAEQKLATAKKAVTRRINELQEEIDTRVQNPQGDKVIADAELKALREEMERVKAIHDSIFKEPVIPKTEGEKRIESLRKQIDKVLFGDNETTPKEVISNEDKATIKQLQAELLKAKQEKGLAKTDAEKEQDAETRRLNDLYEKLDDLINNRVKESKPKKEDSQQIADVKKQIKAIRDARKVRATEGEKKIKQLEKQLNDLLNKKPKKEGEQPTYTTEEATKITQLQDKIKAIQDANKELNKEGNTLKAIDKAIKETNRRIAENDLVKEKNEGVDTPETRARRYILEQSRKQLQQLRDEAGITAERQAEQIVKSLEKNIIDLEADITLLLNGKDLEPSPKKQKVINDKIKALREYQDELKEKRESLLPDEVKQEAKYRTWLKQKNTQLEKLQEKAQQIKDGTYITPTKNPFSLTPLTKEGMEIMKKIKGEQFKIESLMKEREYANRTTFQKNLDFLPIVKRAVIFIGNKIYLKLGAAAVAQSGIFTPLRKIIQYPLSQLFPTIAEKAPSEGFVGWKRGADKLKNSLAKNYSTLWKKESYTQALQALKTGHMDIDVISKGGEKPKDALQGWTKYVIQSHAMIKALPKQAEYWSSHEAASEWAIANGMDLNDPNTQAFIHEIAYQSAVENIFMNRNTLTQTYKTQLAALKNQGDDITATGRAKRKLCRAIAAALEVDIPVVGVPTNIVNQVINYSPLGLINIARVAKGRANWSKLTNMDANLLMRRMGQQGMGILGTAIVLAFYKSLGGFWHRGKEEKDGEPAEGEIQIGDQSISKTLLHHPAFTYAMFMADWMNQNTNTDNEGNPITVRQKINNGLKSAGSLASEVPLLEAPSRIGESFKSTRSLERASAEFVKGFSNPTLFREMSRYMDTDSSGKLTKRMPQNFFEDMMVDNPFMRKYVASEAELRQKEREAKLNKEDNEEVVVHKAIKRSEKNIKAYQSEIEQMEDRIKKGTHYIDKDGNEFSTPEEIRSNIKATEDFIKMEQDNINYYKK